MRVTTDWSHADEGAEPVKLLDGTPAQVEPGVEITDGVPNGGYVGLVDVAKSAPFYDVQGGPEAVRRAVVEAVKGRGTRDW